MLHFFQVLDAAATDPVHAILDIVTPLAFAAVFVVGLLIRSAMAEAATKHIEAAAEVKAELVKRNTEVASALAVHTAKDELMFEGINDKLDDGKEHFEAIERKLDTLQRTKT